MSIQSDIELISIQTMEMYQNKYHLTSQEVSNLFSKYHIYDQILIQHEYLHQVSSIEVLEFVETLILEDVRDLTLYHGTIDSFDTIDLTKSHNRRDFGVGFYTTLLENQAKEWRYRLSLRKDSPHYYVQQYRYVENENLKIKCFDSLSEEWLEFIKENRSKGGLRHDFDIVIGPVADDNTMETIQLYIGGILSVKEAVERLRYNKVNNQISFHSEASLRCLQFIRRDCYG